MGERNRGPEGARRQGVSPSNVSTRAKRRGGTARGRDLYLHLRAEKAAEDQNPALGPGHRLLHAHALQCARGGV
jgi:hypothetical protein